MEQTILTTFAIEMPYYSRIFFFELKDQCPGRLTNGSYKNVHTFLPVMFSEKERKAMVRMVWISVQMSLQNYNMLSK